MLSLFYDVTNALLFFKSNSVESKETITYINFTNYEMDDFKN